MKNALSLSLIIALVASSSLAEQKIPSKQTKITSNALRVIINEANVLGAILIYDLSQDIYYSNDFEWSAMGQLPASTFKIPNTIIGLETGVIKDETTVFEWDGTSKRFKSWEQDMVLQDAFHNSCVPCYRQVARQIGTKQMNAHLRELGFGKMDVSDSSLDMFWLMGESTISPFEQLHFLVNFYNKALPISDRTHAIVKNMMVMEQTATHQISGKTGWSVNGDINNGWFVGYLVKDGNAYFFASNIEPSASFDIRNFSFIRTQITYDALRALDML